MTIDLLNKSKGLNEKITQMKKDLSAIKGSSDTGEISFVQYNSSETNGKVSTYQKKECSGFELQLQTILLATKQTLVSVYEREIDKLQKEFDAL